MRQRLPLIITIGWCIALGQGCSAQRLGQYVVQQIDSTCIPDRYLITMKSIEDGSASLVVSDHVELQGQRLDIGSPIELELIPATRVQLHNLFGVRGAHWKFYCDGRPLSDQTHVLYLSPQLP